MSWSSVGEWLKTNTGSGLALVGSLLTGNVPGAIEFDQVILEFGRWVHISFSERPRMQALVVDKNGTRFA
jgi:hypothetical protein